MTDAAIAFCWGLAASVGLVVGALLGLVLRLGHRVVACVMSLGAGLLLSLASAEVATEALAKSSSTSTVLAIIAGAATFSCVNASLASARHRKRCGECMPQPSEIERPGSGSSIAIGTALDAVPEALILGVTLRSGGPHVALLVAFAFSNLPEALSGTSGMRLAARSSTYVLGVWFSIAAGTALATAVAFVAFANVGTSTIAIFKAYGAGALIAMAAETMIPEAFHNGPRYSGVLAAAGFGLLIVLSAIVD